MKLLHLTDTHYIRQQDLDAIPKVLSDVFTKQPTFDEKMQQLLAQEEIDTFDMVIVTGDLVHESKKETYSEFFEKMTEYFPDLPIHYTLGNHDLKNEFYLAHNGEDTNRFFDYSVEFDNRHFVFLDSATNNESLGSFMAEQLDWIEKELSKNELPKIIFLHHPLFGGEDYQKYSIQDNKPLLQILSNYNVLGLFTGHTHQSAIHSYNNLMQYTSYCFAFGINHVNVDKVLEFNNMTGYTVVDIDDVIAVQPRLISPQADAISSINRSIIEEKGEKNEKIN